MTSSNPIVYTCFCTDIIHEGHLNLINEAKKYGGVVVGVLCDSEMVKYNRFPLKSTSERVKLVEEIPDVSKVIIQDNIMYDKVVEELRPNYIIHGDNWSEDSMKVIKQNILDVLDKYGGELIEVPYTFNPKIQKIDRQMREQLSMPELRRGRLRKLLDMVPVVKTMEVHSGLTGLIVEKTVIAEKDNIDQFDAMWISSLCDSTEKGKPDIELVDMTSRFRTINDIMEVTTKPIIFDGDTGGIAEHFVYTVRSLERMGVSAVIIEDKIGLKKNSLFGTDVEQTQDTIENFCEKISAGKKALQTDEFMIIARIESLILKQGMDDAIKRAKAYVGAGADGIMIHSRESDPAEIFEFCCKFREFSNLPLVVVPTSFNQVYEEEFAEIGVNIVIYANHLIRSAYPSMKHTAELILENERCKEADDECLSIKEILTLIPDE